MSELTSSKLPSIFIPGFKHLPGRHSSTQSIKLSAFLKTGTNYKILDSHTMVSFLPFKLRSMVNCWSDWGGKQYCLLGDFNYCCLNTDTDYQKSLYLPLPTFVNTLTNPRHIVNCSFCTSSNPKNWKWGVIIPIPKKSNLWSSKNWRPVVINCVSNKVLETALNK